MSSSAARLTRTLDFLFAHARALGRRRQTMSLSRRRSGQAGHGRVRWRRTPPPPPPPLPATTMAMRALRERMRKAHLYLASVRHALAPIASTSTAAYRAAPLGRAFAMITGFAARLKREGACHTPANASAAVTVVITAADCQCRPAESSACSSQRLSLASPACRFIGL